MEFCCGKLQEEEGKNEKAISSGIEPGSWAPEAIANTTRLTGSIYSFQNYQI
jgi:hypothetical protein